MAIKTRALRSESSFRGDDTCLQRYCHCVLFLFCIVLLCCVVFCVVTCCVLFCCIVLCCVVLCCVQLSSSMPLCKQDLLKLDRTYV